jgi:hypothetical protein
MIDLIDVFSNALRPCCVRRSVADSEGKKSDEGTVMQRSEPKPNWMALADPPEAHTLRPATTKRASDILANWKISFCDRSQKLRVVNGWTTY